MNIAELESMSVTELNDYLDSHVVPVLSVDMSWWADYKTRYEAMNPGSELVFLRAPLPDLDNICLPNTAETAARIERGDFSRWAGVRTVALPS